MGVRVVVIASGETERKSLPHLTRHLKSEGVEIIDIVFPARNRDVTVEQAEKLIKAAWYSRAEDVRPDKFVILVDTDQRDPQERLSPFFDHLPDRIPPAITASLQFAYAQQHLEAWFFADEQNLRAYLGRDLGNINASQPDSILNPKLHLKSLLLHGVYTSFISAEIAKQLDPQAIHGRSKSFAGFISAVRNGSSSGKPAHSNRRADSRYI